MVLVPCSPGWLSIWWISLMVRTNNFVLVPCSPGWLSIIRRFYTFIYCCVLVPCSPGWLSITKTSNTYKEQSLFSSPVLRGGYRSDTLINSITTRVQVLFWLSKIVTTNTMLLYEMSLFLTNIMIILLILRVYYI